MQAAASADWHRRAQGAIPANAPIEAVLGEDTENLVCFVIDLYARDGRRPSSLESALARKGDLIFGNQTVLRLKAYQREYALRATINGMVAERGDDKRSPPYRGAARVTVLYLSYRAPPEEAGPEKTFDLSAATVQSRWRSGALDLEEGLRKLDEEVSEPPEQAMIVHLIRKSDTP